MSQTRGQLAGSSSHISWLDGLRGAAALWVLASHVQIQSGLRVVPILSWGGMAVDLFMMLSGFLMAHHYLERRNSEPWASRRTASSFWTRRFFRIAPLYYVLLAVAVLLGPWLGEHRAAVAAHWPATATDVQRFTDTSAANVAAHVSFLFGVSPEYSFRTALPDWSIGLEMQFYLLFPLLMITVARFGPLMTGTAVLVACWASMKLAGDFYAAFPMPSFLPMKLFMFFAGMWVAMARAGIKPVMLLVAATVTTAFWSEWGHISGLVFRVLMVVGMFYLMDTGRLPLSKAMAPLLGPLRRAFSTRAARFVGDTSYAVYLLHLLVLTSVAGTLARMPSYVGLHEWARFAICLAITSVIVYPLSWVLHRFIELPGISLGKWLLRGAGSRAATRPAF